MSKSGSYPGRAFFTSGADISVCVAVVSVSQWVSNSFIQLVSQSLGRSVGRSVGQSVSQSVSQSASQSVSQSINKLLWQKNS